VRLDIQKLAKPFGCTEILFEAVEHGFFYLFIGIAHANVQNLLNNFSHLILCYTFAFFSIQKKGSFDCCLAGIASLPLQVMFDNFVAYEGAYNAHIMFLEFVDRQGANSIDAVVLAAKLHTTRDLFKLDLESLHLYIVFHESLIVRRQYFRHNCNKFLLNQIGKIVDIES
jgi:hypothetical protein